MYVPRPTPGKADVTTLPLLTSEDCAALFRVPELFMRCLRAGWLKPRVSKHRLTLYARQDVDACIARIINGEPPPTRERRAKAEGRAE